MGNIAFHENEIKSKLKQRNKLKQFLESLFKSEGKVLERIDFIFCSDEYLLNINIQSLQHNFYTDIITFYYSKKSEPILGEIYISVDRVLENATNFKTNYTEELHRVIFHGCLHLCGSGDKTKKQQVAMREKEGEYLKKYFK